MHLQMVSEWSKMWGEMLLLLVHYLKQVVMQLDPSLETLRNIAVITNQSFSQFAKQAVCVEDNKLAYREIKGQGSTYHYARANWYSTLKNLLSRLIAGQKKCNTN